MPKFFNACAGFSSRWRTIGKRRLWYGGGALIGLVVLILAWHEIALLTLVAYFAAESYPDGVQDGPRVRVDSLLTLSGYPPRQLARYVVAPSARWRAVAISALHHQATEGLDADWTGVAVKLATAALADPEPAVRGLAREALFAVRHIDAEEAAAIFSLVSNHPHVIGREPYIEFAIRHAPQLQPSLQAFATELARSDRVDDQILSLKIQISWFPKSDELPVLFHRLRTNERANEAALVSEFRRILVIRPDLVATLFEGDQRQQRLGLMAAAKVAFTTRSLLRQGAENAGPLAPPSDRQPSYGEDLEKVIDKAVECAAAFIVSSDRDQQSAAHAFLQEHPDGPVLLMRCLERAPHERYPGILNSIDHRIDFTSTGQRLGRTEVKLLLDCTVSADRAVCSAAYHILLRALASYDCAFESGAGIWETYWTPFFRKALEDHPNRAGTLLAFQHFCHCKNVDLGLVPAMETAIRAHPYESDAPFRLLAASFPDHPRVQALAKEALTDVNLAGLVDTAFELLVRTEPDPAAVYAQLLRMYQNPENASRHEYLLGVIRRWKQFGPKNDCETIVRIVDDCLDAYWPEELRTAAPAFVKTMDPTLVGDRLLLHIKARIEAAGSNYGARNYQALISRYRDFPGFARAVEVVALEHLENSQTTTRTDGLRLLAASGVRSPKIDRTLADLLEDGNVVVQIGAADTAAQLKLDNPLVIERLEAMTIDGQQEMVRAAGIRNLAVLRPDAPRTLEIAQALANDSRTAVRAEAARVLRGAHKAPMQ